MDADMGWNKQVKSVLLATFKGTGKETPSNGSHIDKSTIRGRT